MAVPFKPDSRTSYTPDPPNDDSVFHFQRGTSWTSGQIWPYEEVLACIQEFCKLDASIWTYDFPGLEAVDSSARISQEDLNRVGAIEKRLARNPGIGQVLLTHAVRIDDLISRIPVTQTLDQLNFAEPEPWLNVFRILEAITNIHQWGGEGGRACLLLHLKRPGLFPLFLQPVQVYLDKTASRADSGRFLKELPPVKTPYPGMRPEVAIAVMSRMISYQFDLIPNLNLLHRLQNDLEPPCNQLTPVRLLDILLFGYASDNVPSWRNGRYNREFSGGSDKLVSLTADLDPELDNTEAPVSTASSVPSITGKEILTVEDVADYLEVHPRTVTRLLDRKALNGFRVGSFWRIRKVDLERFMDQGGSVDDFPVDAIVEEPVAPAKSAPAPYQSRSLLLRVAQPSPGRPSSVLGVFHTPTADPTEFWFVSWRTGASGSYSKSIYLGIPEIVAEKWAAAVGIRTIPYTFDTHPGIGRGYAMGPLGSRQLLDHLESLPVNGRYTLLGLAITPRRNNRTGYSYWYTNLGLLNSDASTVFCPSCNHYRPNLTYGFQQSVERMPDGQVKVSMKVQCCGCLSDYDQILVVGDLMSKR